MSFSNAEPIYIAAATDASIREQAALASTAGGGTVIIPAGTITLTQALPLLSGVKYKGVGWSCDASAGVGQNIFTGGTILKGDGTFPAFYNVGTVGGSSSAATLGDLGSPQANLAVLFASEISGCGVEDLGLDTFSFGVKSGALYNIGCQDAIFKNLCAMNCTQWGFWFENFDDCFFENLKAVRNANGMRFVGSGTTLYNFGDSHISNPKVYNNTGIGFSLYARGASSYLNDVHVYSLYGNSTAFTSSTQSCTPDGSTAALPVSDLSKFAVGMPVWFSATANGFTTLLIYFVVAVSGASGSGTIQVASTAGGSAIHSTGTTNFNVYTNGFELLEVSTDGLATAITSVSFEGTMDLEAAGTVRALVQGVQGGKFEFADLFLGTNTKQSLAVRSCLDVAFELFSNTTVALDMDSQYYQVNGTSPVSHTGNNVGVGLVSSGANPGSLYLGGGPSADISINTVSNQIALPGRSLQVHTQTLAASGSVFGNTVKFTGGSGQTLTLPAITANYDGYFVFISNPTANSVTVATSSSQNIDGLGATGTSITIAAHSCAHLVACNGSAFYWAHLS